MAGAGPLRTAASRVFEPITDILTRISDGAEAVLRESRVVVEGASRLFEQGTEAVTFVRDARDAIDPEAYGKGDQREPGKREGSIFDRFDDLTTAVETAQTEGVPVNINLGSGALLAILGIGGLLLLRRL